MNRLFNVILNENSTVDQAEQLADTLRKGYGISPKEIRQLYNDAGRDYEKFLELLKQKEDQLQIQKKPQDIPTKDINPLGGEELTTDIEYESEDKLHDEAIIDVLKYLTKYLRNKDRIRVIAARLGIDSDLYQAAGLGIVPDDYDDEDIWNTMDMSDQGSQPFYKSVWQPFYIESMEKLRELPLGVKAEIRKIVSDSPKREVTYPINNPHIDSGITYEAKLIDDLIIENNGKLSIIPKNHSIFIVK